MKEKRCLNCRKIIDKNKKYCSYQCYWNFSRGENHSSYGKHRSFETKEKIRTSKKGKDTLSKEQRKESIKKLKQRFKDDIIFRNRNLEMLERIRTDPIIQRKRIKALTGKTYPDRRTGKYIICAYCGKKFYAMKFELKKGRKYCSRECSKMGKRKGYYKKCLICKKEFYVSYCFRKQKYCSQKCLGISLKGKYRSDEFIKKWIKSFSKRPTSYEQKIIDLCEKYDLPFQYVGDGKIILGHVNPDFIDTLKIHPHLVIETYAAYWKPNNYEEIRHKHLRIPKKNILFLSDDDIKGKKWELNCLQKIQKFCNEQNIKY